MTHIDPETKAWGDEQVESACAQILELATEGSRSRLEMAEIELGMAQVHVEDLARELEWAEARCDKLKAENRQLVKELDDLRTRA